MIHRGKLFEKVIRGLERSPVVALVGPRQVGKTTLAQQVSAQWAAASHHFDLEDPAAAAALESPMTVLGPLEGLIVIDEVQRAPALFQRLRVLADRATDKTRFLLLGSAAPALVRGVSESLAGRIEFIEVPGLTLQEVGSAHRDKLWWRGNFPRAFLAHSDLDSMDWRLNFIQTFLERDLPQLGLGIPSLHLGRFWSMVAHCNGQTWNSADVGASLSIDDKTARRYLDLLGGAFMVRLLPPWFENVGKRQRRAPKIYFRDTGLLHALLRIDSFKALTLHPRLGASWEGFALEHIAGHFSASDLYYWSVHSGPELDLLVVEGSRRLGFEFKFTDAPTLTASMTKATELLSLDSLSVIYPGTKRFRLGDRIEAIPLEDALHQPRTEFPPGSTAR